MEEGGGRWGWGQWPHAGMRPEDANARPVSAVANVVEGKGSGQESRGRQGAGQGSVSHALGTTVSPARPARPARVLPFPIPTGFTGSTQRDLGHVHFGSVAHSSLGLYSCLPQLSAHSSTDATTNTTRTPPPKHTTTLPSLSAPLRLPPLRLRPCSHSSAPLTSLLLTF